MLTLDVSIDDPIWNTCKGTGILDVGKFECFHNLIACFSINYTYVAEEALKTEEPEWFFSALVFLW
jgi:hypothetical protein